MNCHLLLRSLLSSTVKNCKKHIYTTAVNKADVYERDHRGSTKNKFYEPKKSLEEQLWEESSYLDKLKYEFNLYKKHFKLLKKEIKDYYDGTLFDYRRGEVDVFWRFSENPECLEDWIVTADQDCDDGYSSCKLELSSIGTGIFSGTLDTRLPETGENTHAGFCNIRTVNATKSFYREIALDWSNYTHVRMRVRGDGRVYFINIGMKQTFDVQWFELNKYLLMTRGGPYWQDIKIPMSKFFLTHKGRIQDRQQPFEKMKVKNFGITIADKTPGPFKLEIDYIGCEADEYLEEQCAYESYHIDTSHL
ncbi:complex I intermediate-associated protein 30, mitochondrial [Leptopilina boulardi]|uniref:complex I intermediate-associated protein 30, mitochondrial n=1 Tax=Leptopilina boulardi TaxID=63433 RepID=UPI0021F652B9|nr:complex I intermediate-associated protein 30, mitochondrial [Leptopilina boulardi]